MGVEPTSAGGRRRSPILKTGEATGPLPSPCCLAVAIGGPLHERGAALLGLDSYGVAPVDGGLPVAGALAAGGVPLASEGLGS